MKRNELLLDVIGEVKDEYLQEIDSRIKRVRRGRRWKRGLVAACMLLLVGVVVQFAVLFGGGLGSRGGGFSAEGLVAGGYYFHQTRDGDVFRYTPEEGAVRLLKGGVFDRWKSTRYSITANDYGFYYSKGDWIYRIKNGETKSEKLYHYESKPQYPSLYPAGANDIAVRVTYNRSDVITHDEVLIIDGITGECKTVVMEQDDPYYESNYPLDDPGFIDEREEQRSMNTVYADTVTYTVGDRTLELVYQEGKEWYDYAYRLTENGKTLYNGYVEPYNVRTVGDSLVFTVGRGGNNIDKDLNGYVIVSPDGSNHVVNVPSVPGNEKFFFTVKDMDDGQDILAVRVSDNEKFKLKWDRTEEDNVWYIHSDGSYLWAMGFNGMKDDFVTSCYRIEYENGIPTSLTLIDDDITDNN
ncbi:hypothetical protein [Ruminococcus difficilis]|uniref:Uncharacterized protein n=1 Tax=Ruminococcus difficilis TaxID=2763069 RepID=A0A934WTT0_9FIRM|nr:hypothetical protein [Ruminococcus difficilis]MBK6089828.1 hypothetical protein [Ruminococcus difficilis]